MSDLSGLVATTDLNTKIGEAENKIPNFSGLVKNSDSNVNISDIETKYFTISDDDKFKCKYLMQK